MCTLALSRRAAAVSAPLLAVAAGCGGSHGASSAGSSPPATVHPVAFVTRSFRAVATTALVSTVRLPVPRAFASGNAETYTLTTHAPSAPVSRTCFSSGGWTWHVPAAGGGTTALDLTDPQFHQILSAFLQQRPGLAIGLAEMHAPGADSPAGSRQAFSVPPSGLVALARGLAPPALRAGAAKATTWAAATGRGPIQVTAWWSPDQRGLPRRVRLTVSEHSGAGDGVAEIEWRFTAARLPATRCG
jgi:hypothetical protein